MRRVTERRVTFGASVAVRQMLKGLYSVVENFMTELAHSIPNIQPLILQHLVLAVVVGDQSGE